jgi:hypothetical protein
MHDLPSSSLIDCFGVCAIQIGFRPVTECICLPANLTAQQGIESASCDCGASQTVAQQLAPIYSCVCTEAALA